MLYHNEHIHAVLGKTEIKEPFYQKLEGLMQFLLVVSFLKFKVKVRRKIVLNFYKYKYLYLEQTVVKPATLFSNVKSEHLFMYFPILGEGNAQATPAVPQCSVRILHRKRLGARGDAETVQHQTESSQR